MLMPILTIAATSCIATSTPPPASNAPSAPAIRATGKFDEQILTIAQQYKSYKRVSDKTNWAPAMCRVPLPTGAQQSSSNDEQTHGRKLYFLYASNEGAYEEMSQHGNLGYQGTKSDKTAKPEVWINPINQCVVKEAFKPEPAPVEPALETDTMRRQHLPAEYIKLDGQLFHTGDAAGLFIMLKLDPKTEGTDKGWVYAVTSPDAKTIIDAGAIASCIGCHEQTDRDRLYGHKWSWPEKNPAQPPAPANPPSKLEEPIKTTLPATPKQ